MNHTDAINGLSANIKLGRCVLFTATLLSMIACGGSQIKKDKWIPLNAGAPVQGTEKSVDGTVEFEYMYKPADTDGSGTLDISGKVIPRRGLDALDVYVNFLDAKGKQIGVKSIYSSGTGRGVPKRSYAFTVDLPAGTQAIAFSIIGREPPDRF